MGKISEFTELTAADGADLLPIVDVSTGVTKNIKIESLGINLPTLAEVDAVAPTDKMLLYDVSASAYKSVEAGDVGINISTLTQIDALASGDKIPVYDISTSANKYVTANNLNLFVGVKRYYGTITIQMDEQSTISTVASNVLNSGFTTTGGGIISTFDIINTDTVYFTISNSNLVIGKTVIKNVRMYNPLVDIPLWLKITHSGTVVTITPYTDPTFTTPIDSGIFEGLDPIYLQLEIEVYP